MYLVEFSETFTDIHCHMLAVELLGSALLLLCLKEEIKKKKGGGGEGEAQDYLGHSAHQHC